MVTVIVDLVQQTLDLVYISDSGLSYLMAELEAQKAA